MQNDKITIETLKTNRERIISFISKRFSDRQNLNACIKGTMTKMVAMMEGNPKFSNIKPTMANVDKLTFSAFELWLKCNYRKECTVSAEHTEKMAAEYEARKWQSVSF